MYQSESSQHAAQTANLFHLLNALSNNFITAFVFFPLSFPIKAMQNNWVIHSLLHEGLFKFFTIITIQVNARHIKTNLPSSQMQSGVCFMTVKTRYWPDSALYWASYIENYSTPSDTSKPHSSKPGDSGYCKCKALSEGNSLVKAWY